MPVSDSLLHYFICYAVAFLVFGLIGKWYLWSAMKDRAPKSALTPPVTVRVFARERLDVSDAGPCVTGPAKSIRDTDRLWRSDGGNSCATCSVALRTENSLALPMVWLFNIVGILDLIYANISTFKDHVDLTYLGVSYYLAALNVPAMVVVHVLIFLYLLRRSIVQRSANGEVRL